MRKSILLIFPKVVLVFIFIACSKPGGGGNNTCTPIAVNCTGVAKTFAADVNPIIQTFCNQAGCHNAGSMNGPGPLLNYTQISNAKVDIRCAIQSGAMPQNTTLSASQKNTILCWIDNGAPND